MSGEEVKTYIISNGEKLWRVAYTLGMTDSTFSRKLRRDFDVSEFEKVKDAVRKLKKA